MNQMQKIQRRRNWLRRGNLMEIQDMITKSVDTGMMRFGTPFIMERSLMSTVIDMGLVMELILCWRGGVIIGWSLYANFSIIRLIVRVLVDANVHYFRSDSLIYRQSITCQVIHHLTRGPLIKVSTTCQVINHF